MENYTVTYSESVKGWPSFYSYFPDFILGMNQYLYTFKGGNLYRHNTNERRNNYYGVDYDTTLTGVFNQEPTTVKVFKTIELESDDSWDISLVTDLGAGFMPQADFVKKEGSFFAYIKRISGTENLALRSTQGIGKLLSSTGASTGIITLNNFNPDEATNIRLTIAPKSLDLAPKRNQIINIEASRIFVTGSIDNIAYSGPSGAIEYSTNSRLR